MATVKMTPERLAAVLRGAGKIGLEAIQTGARIAKQRGIAHLKQNTPVHTGIMKNAWTAVEGGVHSTSELGSIENSAPYAGIIERGARPHAVSREGVDAIRNWVRLKGFVTDPKEIDAVAWAIVSRLKKHGYKGSFFVEKSLPELTRFLQEAIEERLKMAVEAANV